MLNCWWLTQLKMLLPKCHYFFRFMTKLQMNWTRTKQSSSSCNFQRTSEGAGEHADATAVIFHCEASLRAVLPLLRPTVPLHHPPHPPPPPPHHPPCPHTLRLMDELICCKSLSSQTGTLLLPLCWATSVDTEKRDLSI